MRFGCAQARRRPSRTWSGPVHRRADRTSRGGGASTRNVGPQNRVTRGSRLARAPRVVLRTCCEDGAQISSFILLSTSTSGSPRRHRWALSDRGSARGAAQPAPFRVSRSALSAMVFASASSVVRRRRARRRARARFGRVVIDAGGARPSSPSSLARSSRVAISLRVRSPWRSSSSASLAYPRRRPRAGSDPGHEVRADGGCFAVGSRRSMRGDCLPACVARQTAGRLGSAPSARP